MHIVAFKSPKRQNKNLTGGYMSKKEFKEAMLRGLGRCVIAVEKDPEKYRDAVLWACKRNFAYDAQSEGTRSWYVYTMASSYPDKETFIDTAAEALGKYRPHDGWNLLHLSELLMFFAMDGYESARQAVEEKYQEILADMFIRKRRPNRIFYELSDLEQLGLVLAIDSTAFLRIAKDFGRLYLEKSYMEDGDFPWFFSSKGSRYKKEMEQAAAKDEAVACFLRRESAGIEANNKLWEQRKAGSPDGLIGVRLSRWLATKADRETVKQYAATYRQQTQTELRAEALTAFSRCPYPDDPHPIIEDAYSACAELQNAAWQALENIRHPAVRAFALANVTEGNRTPENFALLVTNYIPKDGQMLEALLREQIMARDWDRVHAAGLDIYRAFYKNSGIPHPKHLLSLLYEYNPCSYCRETALVYMSKHRMLTKEMLEECQFDSNDDIREFASKRLK